MRQEFDPHRAVADPDNEVFLSKSEASQEIDRQRDELNISRKRTFTNDVRIELVKLAQASALLLFVTKELRAAKPFERLLEILLACCHHSCERRGHLRPHGNMPAAFVWEIEKLFDQFAAAFLLVKLDGLQNRPVILGKTVTAGYFAPR